jgi:hypothetical protein
MNTNNYKLRQPNNNIYNKEGKCEYWAPTTSIDPQCDYCHKLELDTVFMFAFKGNPYFGWWVCREHVSSYVSNHNKWIQKYIAKWGDQNATSNCIYPPEN